MQGRHHMLYIRQQAVPPVLHSLHCRSRGPFPLSQPALVQVASGLVASGQVPVVRVQVVMVLEVLALVALVLEVLVLEALGQVQVVMVQVVMVLEVLGQAERVPVGRHQHYCKLPGNCHVRS